MKKIFIDAGHGGHDSGATGNGLLEKDLVLKIALKIRDILQNDYEGVSVSMSRTTDVFVGLNRRAQLAVEWGADGFLSVHLNAFTTSANGCETYKHDQSNVSGLRDNLHSAILKELRGIGDVTDRGLKSANFAVLRGTYRSMKTALTEALFITNPNDAALLKQEGTIDAIARGHAKGLANEFSLKLKSKSSTSIKEPSNSSNSTTDSKTFSNLSPSDKHKEVANACREAGISVYNLQNLLIAAGVQLPQFGADNKAGNETLLAIQTFQRENGISSSSGNNYGRPGPKTLEELQGIVKYRRLLRNQSPMLRGNDVRSIQRALGVEVDGLYGPMTASAVHRYQTTNNLEVDGIVGPETWGHLFG